MRLFKVLGGRCLRGRPEDAPIERVRWRGRWPRAALSVALEQRERPPCEVRCGLVAIGVDVETLLEVAIIIIIIDVVVIVVGLGGFQSNYA